MLQHFNDLIICFRKTLKYYNTSHDIVITDLSDHLQLCVHIKQTFEDYLVYQIDQVVHK